MSKHALSEEMSDDEGVGGWARIGAVATEAIDQDGDVIGPVVWLFGNFLLQGLHCQLLAETPLPFAVVGGCKPSATSHTNVSYTGTGCDHPVLRQCFLFPRGTLLKTQFLSED